MSSTAATLALAHSPALLSRKMQIGAILGPVLGLLFWFAPLGIAPVAQHALAVVLFMAVLWITEPVDYGVTTLMGLFLFWALKITKFETAFSGFADSTPWFLFGAMLMGEAASRSGLARRIGYAVMRVIGTSYSRVLFSMITFVLILNFLVPSGLAQITIVGPIAMGIVTAFGAGQTSNIGRGMFVIITYCCGLFNKMMLAGGAAILTRGMLEKMTGKTIFWSQYIVAFLPAILLTVIGCWLVTLWLYPPEKKDLPGGKEFLSRAAAELGPWTVSEKKSLFWLLLAIAFFFADGGFAIVGPYAAEVWPSHLRTSGMGSAYGFGGIGKIIGPVGLALIVGSGNYLKPDVPLPEIPLAFLYLGFWFLMTGTVYYFFGIETRGKSIEQIDRELAVIA